MTTSLRPCAFCGELLPKMVDNYCAPAYFRFVHERCEGPMRSVLRLRRSALNRLSGVVVLDHGKLRGMHR